MSVELLNIDCMEYMRDLEDDAFDLAIVDPPYFVDAAMAYYFRSGLAQPTQTTPIKNWKIPDKDYFIELARVSKNQIIWGANYFANDIPRVSPSWIVWDKETSGEFSDCELAMVSFEKRVRKIKFRWNGMIQQNMEKKEIRIHPTQKPMQLYRWILENYAKPGQRILDTHLGSGSSAIAAHYFGCDFVGCEIDRDYYEAACKRFDDETRQIAMF